MAKRSVKTISIAAFDKAAKENTSGPIIKDWFGNEVVIRTALSAAETLDIVNDIVNGCFLDDGTYLPEMKDFMMRDAVLSRIANFSLPDKLEHRWELVMNSGAADMVIDALLDEQGYDHSLFVKIGAYVNERVNHMLALAVSHERQQLRLIISAMEDIRRHLSDTFDDVDKEDMGAIVSAIANGKIDEDKLVGAYLALRHTDADEPDAEPAAQEDGAE